MLFCFFFVPNLSLRFENRVSEGRKNEVLGAEIKFSVFEFLRIRGFLEEPKVLFWAGILLGNGEHIVNVKLQTRSW